MEKRLSFIPSLLAHLKSIGRWSMRWLHGFLITQLMLMQVSTPILMAWGLPISSMSILGNIIFIPLIIIFLSTASIIFFWTLLMPPPPIIPASINLMASWWMALLGASSRSWLIPLPAVAWPLALIPPGIALAKIATTPPSARRTMRWILASGIAQALTIMTIQLLFPPAHLQEILPKLVIMHANNKTIMHDYGAFNRRGWSSSFVRHQLLPEIIKHRGTLTIDRLILKPGYGAFVHAEKLSHLVTLREIVIPFFETSSRMTKRAFASLAARARSCNIVIKRTPLLEEIKSKPRRPPRQKHGRI